MDTLLPPGYTSWAELKEFLENELHADLRDCTCGELVKLYKDLMFRDATVR